MNKIQTSPKTVELDKTQKILALQQQLLNMRKQMSKKHSQWQKQRSNLLSKNQIANIEIMELKQRLANLAKINQTLTHAMTSQQQPQPQLKNKVKKQLTIIGQQRNRSASRKQDCVITDVHGFDSNTSDGKRSRKGVDQIFRLNKIVQQKDYQIKNLTKIGQQLRQKIQQRNALVSSLEQAVFNLRNKVQTKQEEILKAHKQIQQLQQKIQQNCAYIDQNRTKSAMGLNAHSGIYNGGMPGIKNNNKILNISQLQSQQLKKYPTKNSSYLIMKPTPDHSGYQMDNNTSYINQIDFTQPSPEYEQQCYQQQQQKLLCENCSRVFSIMDFQKHAKTCKKKVDQNYQVARNLLSRKKQIQYKLEKIRLEEEKQNLRSRFEGKFQYQDNKTNRDKINQIREIATGLQGKGKQYKKQTNQYNDFGIRNSPFYQ